jgi:hypothetical protein
MRCNQEEPLERCNQIALMRCNQEERYNRKGWSQQAKGITFALVTAMGIDGRCPRTGDKYTFNKTKRINLGQILIA